VTLRVDDLGLAGNCRNAALVHWRHDDGLGTSRVAFVLCAVPRLSRLRLAWEHPAP
jgi:hypothetical protein